MEGWKKHLWTGWTVGQDNTCKCILNSLKLLNISIGKTEFVMPLLQVLLSLLLWFVQHWQVFVHVSEIFILVPALLGLKGNLEMTLASRLSTQVRSDSLFDFAIPCTFTNAKCGYLMSWCCVTEPNLLYWKEEFANRCKPFRTIGIGFVMFIRSTRNQLLEYLENRLT